MCHTLFDRKFSCLFISADKIYHLNDGGKLLPISGPEKHFLVN